MPYFISSIFKAFFVSYRWQQVSNWPPLYLLMVQVVSCLITLRQLKMVEFANEANHVTIRWDITELVNLCGYPFLIIGICLHGGYEDKNPSRGAQICNILVIDL